MSCSQARLNANRRNATKSTGPRTSAGKARSSRNALKHGFCATASSLAPLEDKEAYAAFTAAIADSLRPATPLEEELADRIADLSWRLRRIPDAEAELLARDTAHDLTRRCRRHLLDDPHEDGTVDQASADADADAASDDLFPDSPARLLADAMRGPQNPYLTLQRYEQSLDRARSRALKELRQLQKDRREIPIDDEQPPRRNEAISTTSDETPSPSGGEGWGEGEASDDDGAPLRNEPTAPPQVASDQGPVTSAGELRNEPNPPSVSSPAEQPPQSQIQNRNSQIESPRLFHLKRSDLRPVSRSDNRGQSPHSMTC